MNKFNTDIAIKYFEKYDGSIIFANGDECIIYKYDNKFIKVKHMNANLIKRHKKGGQSSLRFSRLADESRVHYVNHIIDYLNLLRYEIKNTKVNNYIFGSKEILDMIFERKESIYINIINGGFYNFNGESINNTKHWLKYLKPKENNDEIFEKVLNYLEINIDILDFDPNNKENMRYYIVKQDNNIEDDKKIIMDTSSKNYSQLCKFEYIGVKYYENDIDIE